MPSNPVASAARAVTNPLRGYVNEHFELTKAEIRVQTEAQTKHLHDVMAGELSAVAARVEALDEAVRSQSTAVDRQAERIRSLLTMVSELQSTNDQLLAVIADLVKRDDGPAV